MPDEVGDTLTTAQSMRGRTDYDAPADLDQEDAANRRGRPPVLSAHRRAGAAQSLTEREGQGSRDFPLKRAVSKLIFTTRF